MPAPDPAAAVVRRLVAFAAALRAAGLAVGPARVADATAGLAAAGVEDRRRVYWTLRQTLVSSADGLEAFDRVFAAWFGGDAEAPPPPPGDSLDRSALAEAAAGTGETRVAARAEEAGRGGFSPDELLRGKDFAELGDEERRRLRELIAALGDARPRRRSRRLRPHRRGATLDLRRVARASLAAGGDPSERVFRRRTEKRRRLVVLCDVSASMEPYAEAMLLFVHSLLRAGGGVEAFVFATRLTRVTAALGHRDPDRALAAATALAPDWSGGTRIGSSLRTFNDRWGSRAGSHGAVVVIVSDGWEIGDTTAIGRELRRLARRAYAVVWMNPLRGRPGYRPLTGGMRAALPHVDRFLPGHNLESLEALVEALRGIDVRHARRPARYPSAASISW